MTPRQIVAYHTLALQRRNLELAQMLTIFALGARGEQKAVDQQIAMLTDGQ